MRGVAVVGTTSWGTTLSIILARKGLEVWLWARTAVEAEALDQARENRVRLPGVALPHQVHVSNDLERCLDSAELVILAVPSQTMRSNVQTIKPYLRPTHLIMSAAKGLELDTAQRMSQVLAEELSPALHSRICVLSGPNLSQEIALGMPSATVVAASDLAVAEAARDVVMTSRLRAYSSTDVVGVELGGTLKNIIALGAGMGEGLGYGDNAKAAFMTRGLAEISRLGAAAGANPFTFLGLAGLGDLVATCSSRLSRNRRAGEELAKGRPLSEVLADLGGVAEGVPTTKAARDLAHSLGVEMPITEEMYRVLYEGRDLTQAIMNLMAREPKHELAGLG